MLSFEKPKEKGSTHFITPTDTSNHTLESKDQKPLKNHYDYYNKITSVTPLKFERSIITRQLIIPSSSSNQEMLSKQFSPKFTTKTLPNNEEKCDQYLG